MTRPAQQALARLLLVVTLCWLLPPPGALAQESPSGGEGEIYRIGAGDVLQLNVPQRPELDRELNVQSDGSVYMAPIGEVDLLGLTVEEAEQVLSRRLSLYDPGIQQVVLGMVEYNALRIFVLGAVSSPGSYTFESEPTLWDVLRAAGGPAESANLANCRIISVEEDRPRSQTVNLSGYLSGESFPDRTLQGGDTLVVPSVADGRVGVPSRSGVQVFGGVATPTTVPIEQPTELLTVLMLAGAPMTEADLSKVDWVRRPGAGNGDQAQRVNLRDFLEDGRPKGNPLVYPGDVVHLHVQRDGWFSRNLPLFLSFVSAVTTTLLAYDRLSD